MTRRFYAEEEIESVVIPPKHKLLPLIVCYDSDLAHYSVTRVSTGVIVVMVGKSAIIHKLKRQTSIETSTCGPELNAGIVSIYCC